MAKFSFKGNITGDNHQFGDHNTQINNWLRDDAQNDLYPEDISLIRKIVQNSDNVNDIKKIFGALYDLGNDHARLEDRDLQDIEKSEIKALSDKIKNQIKKDKLEEATTILEQFFTKIKAGEHLNQLAIFQAHIKNLSRQYVTGTQNHEDMLRFRARAYQRLLAMIPEIK